MPSVYDLLHLAAYLPMIVAAVLFIRLRRGRGDATKVTDTLIVLVVGALVITLTVLNRIMTNPVFGPNEVSVWPPRPSWTCCLSAWWSDCGSPVETRPTAESGSWLRPSSRFCSPT